MSERERETLERIDEELQQALDVAPSPEFLPRVRQRVAQEGAPDRPWMQWLGVAAAGAAMTVFAMRLLQPPSPQPAANAAVATARPEAPAVTPAAGPSASSASVRPAQVVPRISAAHLAARTPEPEVLVPAGQETLLRCLAEDVRQQRVDPASLFVSSPETGEPKGIGITPIEVALIGVRPIVEE